MRKVGQRWKTRTYQWSLWWARKEARFGKPEPKKTIIKLKTKTETTDGTNSGQQVGELQGVSAEKTCMSEQGEDHGMDAENTTGCERTTG